MEPSRPNLLRVAPFPLALGVEVWHCTERTALIVSGNYRLTRSRFCGPPLGCNTSNAHAVARHVLTHARSDSRARTHTRADILFCRRV